MPYCASSWNKDVCKCDRQAKTHCAHDCAQQIIRLSNEPGPVANDGSGVLLGAQIALVIQPFLARAALVVFPVRRSIRRGAVLVRRVRCRWLIARAAGWALIALRMARGAPQCGMSHDGRLQGRLLPERGVDRAASP
ncbi:hypothetical protein BN2476_240156 [Paraburkholderia piptadeniae]|uniref:Uncharacterized protein n=1 Tax=Paraburkholderia piptadeniae TaxID=1701573 RepID=A0A1N7RZE5_9BURK|nr:hypothetical protein BN2476_240156 [Paraburkholderia piptadeniae]